nr:unnamed protein product [Digitaria exilis]
MANFAIDPHPHVLRGFEVVPPNAPPTRLYAYLGGVMDAYNEDLAIAFLLPAVAKEDLQELAEAIKSYFRQELGVRLNEVQPSPIGDAFMRFGSPIERERFLDRVIQFGHGYTLRFIKHDEGNHIHLHDEAKIPDDVVVSMDLEPRCDEPVVDVLPGDVVGVQPSPPLIVPSLTPLGFENVMIKVNNCFFHIHFLPKPINFFGPRQIKYFFCNLDTIVPSYISDEYTWRFLASIAFDPMAQEERRPGFIGPLPLPKPMVSYPASDDEEVQEIESLPPSSSTRKRRRRMMREPLDVAFLRRSARLAQDDDFINNASAEAAVADNPSVYTAQHGSSSSAAPYLNIETIQGIATGYLQIQPGAISAAALFELDDEDINPNV